MKKIITFVALIALTATATAQNESMGFGIRGGGSITGYNGKTIKGLSLLGGDPTYPKNIKPLLKFIKKFKENLPDRDIWIWSGFTWEEILEDKNRFSLIKECDVLIDGKFVDSLKDLNLKWKGSSNQRVIDIKKSLEENKVIEYI